MLKIRNPGSGRMIDISSGLYTYEMLKDAPAFADVVDDIARGLEGAIVVAHHAPFDIGFWAQNARALAAMFPTTAPCSIPFDWPVPCSAFRAVG